MWRVADSGACLIENLVSEQPPPARADVFTLVTPRLKMRVRVVL